MTLRGSLRPLAGLALPLTVALVAGGCVPAPSPTPTPAVVSTVRVRVAPAPRPTTSATPTVRPVAAAAPAAPSAVPFVVPKPKPKPKYVFARPHDPPKILAITISSVDVTGGDTVSGSVETTSNVASVEARIAGWSMSLPRTRIGHFEAEGQIPDVAFLVKGTYKLEVIARNADGVKAERDIPITLH